MYKYRNVLHDAMCFYAPSFATRECCEVNSWDQVYKNSHTISSQVYIIWLLFIARAATL